MNIHEYQAAELFAKHGIPVNPGRVARSPAEAAEHAHAFGGPVAVKAQVQSGGRGQDGRLTRAHNPDGAEPAVALIPGVDH